MSIRAKLDEPTERALLARLINEFDRFMDLDAVAFRALQAGREAQVRRIFLGPELEIFEAMAATSERLARYEDRRASATSVPSRTPATTPASA